MIVGKNIVTWHPYWLLACVVLAVVIHMNMPSIVASVGFGFLGASLLIALQQIWVEFVSRLFRLTLTESRVPVREYLIYISMGVLVYVSAVSVLSALGVSLAGIQARIVLAPVMLIGTYAAVRRLAAPNHELAQKILLVASWSEIAVMAMLRFFI